VSLLLEFVALARLRVREPSLERPFRIPGGPVGVALIGVPPMALLALAAIHGRAERVGSVSTLAIAGMVVLAGPLVYWLTKRLGS
jgi:hypothetical protein